MFFSGLLTAGNSLICSLSSFTLYSKLLFDQKFMANPNGIIYSSAKSPQHPKSYTINQGVDYLKKGNGHLSMLRKSFSLRSFDEKKNSQGSSFVCQSTETRDTDTKDRARSYKDRSSITSPDDGNENSVPSRRGLREACKFMYNDARFVNERAKNDIVLLARGIMRLDARARQDVAFLGSEFLKIDARAREDTEKIDHDVKKRAERLHHIATILKMKAQFKLRKAADKHWNNGALEADLKRADIAAKRRAMEDSLMALELIKNLQDRMTNKRKRDPIVTNGMPRDITLENNRKTLDFIFGEVSADRINAVQEAYYSIASALSEADGIDYTDPEELEFLVTTLIDLDAMDGKSSVSLLAECSSSPDVSTRRALANALSAAPSMWTLGNAGMGALQRLAKDPNPSIAAAALKTIYELKKQWEMDERDKWSNGTLPNEKDDNETD